MTLKRGFVVAFLMIAVALSAVDFFTSFDEWDCGQLGCLILIAVYIRNAKVLTMEEILLLEIFACLFWILSVGEAKQNGSDLVFMIYVFCTFITLGLIAWMCVVVEMRNRAKQKD